MRKMATEGTAGISAASRYSCLQEFHQRRGEGLPLPGLAQQLVPCHNVHDWTINWHFLRYSQVGESLLVTDVTGAANCSVRCFENATLLLVIFSSSLSIPSPLCLKELRRRKIPHSSAEGRV
jgi:hypothetical protein